MEVRTKRPAKWLTPTGGFLEGYTHTLNPYAGCSFACSYCYVRRMPVGLFRGIPWGDWLDVKTLEGDAFRKEWARARARGTLTVFMSSATDPYQPAEASHQVTRSLLEVMADEQPDFLLVQTRSPLVTRDIDLLQRFGDRVRVSLTIETDREDVRRAFTPAAPPLAGRFRALRELREAGIPAQAAVSPLLPHSEAFAGRMAEAASRIVVDDYFHGDGAGGRRTEALGIRKLHASIGESHTYDPEAGPRFAEELKAIAAGRCDVRWSREGFLP